ncbi:MAG: CARDB domain-containing protein, partial [Gammaproteobacteria bacterium]
IGAEEATNKVAGLCQFRMQYRIKNQGQADAQPLFGTKVSKGVTSLHIANTPRLNKGQTRLLSGNLKLSTGNNLLIIKTDHANKVDESNEGNNTVRIMVNVKGDCGSNSTPARPGSSTPTPPRPTGIPARPIR